MRVDRNGAAFVDLPGGTQELCPFAKPFGIRARSTIGGVFDMLGPNQVIERCVGFRFYAFAKISQPGLPMVNPGVNSVVIPSKLGNGEIASPAIVH